MLIGIRPSLSRAVKARSVSYAPGAVLKISGGRRASVGARASKPNSMSRVIDRTFD
jgi:hypothetical protein